MTDSQNARAWNLAHPERAAATCARYRQTPNAKAVSKKWREANKEYLKACMNQWRKDHPEEWKAIAKRSRIKNMDKVLIRNRQREIHEYTAMPSWADKGKIEAIYVEAKRLTRETGVRHEVDHFYPLRGKNSCGLHVHYNLRIITATQNRKKFNKLPEEFPC